MVFLNNANLHPLGITFANLIVTNWELKHTFLQILPKFSDIPGEDLQLHLHDFEMAWCIVRVQGNKGEYISLLAFPFSFQDGARAPYYTWRNSDHLVTASTKVIWEIVPSCPHSEYEEKDQLYQDGGEWEFQWVLGEIRKLLAKSPLHNIPEPDLIQYFMARLRPWERAWVNATCDGSVFNKLPNQAMKLFDVWQKKWHHQQSKQNRIRCAHYWSRWLGTWIDHQGRACRCVYSVLPPRMLLMNALK